MNIHDIFETDIDWNKLTIFSFFLPEKDMEHGLDIS